MFTKGNQPITRMPVLAIAITLGGMLMAGCAHPRWERKSAERRASIRHTTGEFVDRERASQSNLRELQTLHQTRVERRQEHLRRRWGFVESRFEQEFVDWRESSEERRKLYRKVWRGKPETIPDTWADLAF